MGQQKATSQYPIDFHKKKGFRSTIRDADSGKIFPIIPIKTTLKTNCLYNKIAISICQNLSVFSTNTMV